jgi:hypothetical protein
MRCARVEFSGHAVRQMFQRHIRDKEVLSVIKDGCIIAEYLEDKPYPSVLVLGFAGDRPIHVVVGRDESSGLCVVVTAYIPDLRLWTDDFVQRRSR